MDEDQLIEQLAHEEHLKWMNWTKEIYNSEWLTAMRSRRWSEDLFVPYDKLSKEDKEIYRNHARKVIGIIKKSFILEHRDPVGPSIV